jgi:queuine tRNA-ribosyltransferase
LIFPRLIPIFEKLGFTLVHTDGNARAGILHTGRGDVLTPVFMPVGTQGAVKAVEHRELEEAGTQILLCNTYHLYLRPGMEVIRKAGGLHALINWQRPILTDSGGYQVFSLTELRRIEEEGIEFRSHLDGSRHFLTPESAINIQRTLGSDVMMVLDECTPFPCERDYAEKSGELTIRWAERCRRQAERSNALYGKDQALFAVTQGGVHEDLRERSVSGLVSMDFDGFAIGGLAVGEPHQTMYDITALCTGLLPPDKPRYLMGVGTPDNIVESIGRGVDIFDCVLPTRNGRNGMVFTRNGKLNLRNVGNADDFIPVDEQCPCYGCRTFSRAYLRHLFKSGEILGLQLASLHNLTFFLWLTAAAREAIVGGRFQHWREQILGMLSADAQETPAT